MLVALPLCGPFGWHHRTQMTSWEARGFQHQHLALWQPVRPSVPSLGCLQMFLILWFASLVLPLQGNVHTKTSQARRIGGSFAVPSRGGFYKMPEGGISENINQVMSEEDGGDGLEAGGSKQIALFLTPPAPSTTFFFA